MNEVLLSASGETAWQALWQHMEWAQGFWLGWVFTNHTPSVHELHRRTEALLRGVGRMTVVRQPRKPAELVDILTWLIAGADDCDGCVIVSVVSSGEAWREAWDQFMLRLNERRELLRGRIRGGLLLFAPTSFKAPSREAAPDLWSIRSLALDVAPVMSEGVERTPASRLEQETFEGSDTEVTLALQAVAAARAAGQTEAEVEAEVRAAKALFAVGRRDEGRIHATRAVERAAEPTARARAIETLANIEGELGDFVAAERHYRAAIELDPEGVKIWAYWKLSGLLMLRHALVEARTVTTAGLARIHVLQLRSQGPAEQLLEQAAGLQCLGDVRAAEGDWSGGADEYGDALALSRKYRAVVGDTSSALHVELESLRGVGDMKQAQGDWSGAGEVQEAALILCRQIRGMVGDIPEALRDESVSLSRVGDVKFAQGDLHEAGSAYAASLALSRQIRSLVGDTTQALRDEAVDLIKVGDVKRTRGDWGGAAAAYEVSLQLVRQVRDIIGSTPEALRSEAVSLDRIGLTRQAQEDWDGALEAHEASLELFRRVRRAMGDTLNARELTATGLQHCAAVYCQLGQLDRARAALTEAEALWREVQAHCGRLPRNMYGLAATLETWVAVRQREIEQLQTPV